jgi:hypothetical protein
VQAQRRARPQGGNACTPATGTAAAATLSRNAAAVSLAKRVGAISALPLVVGLPRRSPAPPTLRKQLLCAAARRWKLAV